MAVVSGRRAKIRLTSATPTLSTDEASDISTDGLTVTIDSTARRHWDRSSTRPVLFSGAADISTDIAEVNYVQGKVTLDTALSTSATYTLDVSYLTASHLVGGRDWEVEGEVDMLDVSSFSTSTADVVWRTFIDGISEAEARLTRFISTGSTEATFMDRLTVGQDVVAEFILNDFNKFEAYARISDDGHAVGVDEAVEESVTLRIDGTMYYSTV